MKPLYGVYGASGCGRGVMPLLRRQLATADVELVFIDDDPAADAANGHPIWTFDRFASEPASQRLAALAVANAGVREMLDQRCRSAGIDVIGVSAGNVVVMDDVEIGPGALLSPFVTLTSNIRIGRCFHGNLYSYVEHDCVIGDYVTFAPGVRCNGNVTIGSHAYIGSGAIIRQGISIGASATVGMGAVVTKDVPPGVTVIGNPARIMEKK
ncbi:NeuD/PglB/VioB family sugar acetyltransferase [Pelagerythrobacter rhizovicinus]|uniref:Acetyltransferase n=1 Tax=Pelagerythrobacter rhizovicinus TaxID=2268576 RepID=A0A4Q2KNH1_9SPHN|nr:NeuD/PglB/VioB family sugar acetyltransferase [Pelagerythrobacter rhizovicinus]RXZ64761.1 acetyltransferase [Pelagerythrobacter rhizovicinus]